MATDKDRSILSLDSRLLIAAAGICLALLPPAGAARATAAKSDAPPQYTLRYKFQPGQAIRWQVVHRCRVRTTVSGSTQTAETTSTSEKLWQVKEVRPDGSAVFEHSVAWVDMRQKLTGRSEVHYDSRTDLVAPQGFENLRQSVGVPLSIVTMDVRGKVLDRKRNPVKAAVASEGEITLPLPEEPIAVGHQWSFPHDIELPLPGGGVRKIKSRQTFVLESVKTGVAAIRVATQILSPIHDPAIEGS